MPAENFARTERLIHDLELEDRERTERVRDLLRECGRQDLVEALDRRLREIEAGITGARSAWHSISDAQRRALVILAVGNRRLVRQPGSQHLYMAVGEPYAEDRVATLPGVRALASRGLLEWTGGAFDPEKSAILTEQARFVLKHGRPAPGMHFEGYRP